MSAETQFEMTTLILRKEAMQAEYAKACLKHRACLRAERQKEDELQPFIEAEKAALAECVRLGAELMEEDDG